MKKIALLGATGYIGKSLLHEFFDDKSKFQLFLFSRPKDNIKNIVKDKPKDCDIKVCPLDEFNLSDYDVIINCTGIGDPLVLKNDPSSIFKVTEEIDNMIIGYLERKPKTIYINLSSGAVYGDSFEKAITSETKSILNINNIRVSEYYAVAKINAEAKHRSVPNLNIVDLRVFAFFGHFVNTKTGFLMSEIVDCIKNKKVFETNEVNIVRDYITPKDLFSLIKLIIKKGKINDFFDVYSLKPISKFELLSFLEKKYGLKYVINKSSVKNSNSSKNIYYSKNKKAGEIGYSPTQNSMNGIGSEIDKMILFA